MILSIIFSKNPEKFTKMTSKKYLSNKKTTQQTISISPALKDWVKRYVNVMKKKYPNDENYRSISTFYCFVMEKVLTIFKEGKTLDDFNRFLDAELHKVYGKNIIVFAPFLEECVEMNAFSPFDKTINSEIYFNLRNFFIKTVKDSIDLNSLKMLLERAKKLNMKNNIPKEINFEISTGKNKKGYDGVIEHKSEYEFLQIQNVKAIVSQLGMLGVKIKDVYYSPKERYFRVKMTTTPLFFEKKDTKEARNERINLAKENLQYLINFNRLLEYKSAHLWQRLAEDYDSIALFNNEQALNRGINKIENDIKKFGTKDDFHLKLLKAFERLHWIRIENEDALEFQIRLSNEKYNDEIQFLKNYLSKYSEIIGNDNFYYLKRKP
jgi:hypothetical protein